MTQGSSIMRMGRAAKKASRGLATTSSAERNHALELMAATILSDRAAIMRANQKDIAAGRRAGLSNALLDRLVLTDRRIEAMAEGLRDVARLPDPVGEVIESTTRPNGLAIDKVRVPIGVIGIIYESRPNVTSDCAGLCLKSGNACVLKGGSEARYSNKAIFDVLRDALRDAGLDREALQMVTSRDRDDLRALLSMNDVIDLVIPRGGEGLIRFVTRHSRIPVIKHYKGVCHTYVGEHADLNQAERICFNAKVQRPGVCNAMETLLVHRDVAARFLPGMIKALIDAGVEIRGCPVTRKICREKIKAATAADWAEEYLDLILAVRVVESLDEAMDHIQRYGSAHSDAIVTDSADEAARFLNEVDSACVYWNASTRFTDGYEFGLGAEIGISTDKIHARGPMGLRELTSYKFVVRGTGQIRE